MDKPTLNTYPLNPLIAHRWSPRAFADRPIDSAVLCSLLEAARWAPSSFNEQPWRFIVGDSERTLTTHQKIREILVPQNNWAHKAPVLILTVAKLTFSHNGNPNRHAFHDVGLAMGNLTMQAMEHGIYVHQMAGIDTEKAIAVFGIPQGYEPVAGAALGYLGSPDQLTGELKERELAPRSRNPLQDILFAEQWGQGFPVCFS